MAKRVQLHVTDSRDRREGHVEGVEPRIAFYQHETDCAYRQRDPEQPGDENDTANQTAGHRSIPTKMSRCDCFPSIFRKRDIIIATRLKLPSHPQQRHFPDQFALSSSTCENLLQVLDAKRNFPCSTWQSISRKQLQ